MEPGIECVLSKRWLSELANSNPDQCKITNVEVLIEENEEIYLRVPPNSIRLLLFFLETSSSVCSYPVWSRSFLSVFVIMVFSQGPGLREGSMWKTQPRLPQSSLSHPCERG